MYSFGYQQEEVWLPAKELLNLLNIVNPPYPCRNVISTLVSDCFAMPMGVEIGFHFKNNINMARREELNRDIHKTVWKYSPHAKDLLIDFLIKFPVVAGAIIAGEITEKDDPTTNTNKYVYGIPEKIVDGITQWRLYHQNEIFEPAPIYYYPDSRGELVEFNTYLYNPYTPSDYHKKQHSYYTKNVVSTLNGKEPIKHKPSPQQPAIVQKVSSITPAKKGNGNESDDYEHEDSNKNSRTLNAKIKKKRKKKKIEKIDVATEQCVVEEKKKPLTFAEILKNPPPKIEKPKKIETEVTIIERAPEYDVNDNVKKSSASTSQTPQPSKTTIKKKKSTNSRFN